MINCINHQKMARNVEMFQIPSFFGLDFILCRRTSTGAGSVLEWQPCVQINICRITEQNGTLNQVNRSAGHSLLKACERITWTTHDFSDIPDVLLWFCVRSSFQIRLEIECPNWTEITQLGEGGGEEEREWESLMNFGSSIYHMNPYAKCMISNISEVHEPLWCGSGSSCIGL